LFLDLLIQRQWGEGEGAVYLDPGFMGSLHAEFSLHWDHEPASKRTPLPALSPSEGERGLPVAQGRRYTTRGNVTGY